MPVIATFPDPIRAYVRVETNWADAPGVDFARVLRVDSVTGICTPLRPYICFSGDYLAVSCGHAMFWDTEVPLDRQVFYITEGLGAPCIPVNPVLLDTFSRTVANGWGTSDTGQTYPTFSGAAAQYSVGAGQGVITPDATNTSRFIIADVGISDYTATIVLTDNTIPTGAATGEGLAIRFVDTNNYYRIMIAPAVTTGIVTLSIARVLAGVTTVLASTVITGPGVVVDQNIKVRAFGSSISAKAWAVTETEPTAFNLTVSDSNLLTSTLIGAIARRETGNLTPTAITFDDFTIAEPCLPCEPVTATAPPLTVGSDGKFRLKDPVRPCHDQVVPLCFDQVASPDCLPGSGIFFASMGGESFDTNSLSVNPTNAEFPIAISRTRRGVASTLTLVTRTFADRDALKLITKPGSPLLFQGPPQYGIPDQYMDIGPVDYERGKTDHRFQIRVVGMPYTQVDRPAGPMLGVCGSRVMDMCDTFDTWDEMAAAGLTWDDLIRGRAGQPDPTVGLRTWDDVLAEFADWDDVNNGTRTWTGLEMGD